MSKGFGHMSEELRDMSERLRHIAKRLGHMSKGLCNMWKGVPDIARLLIGQENLGNDFQSWKLRNPESAV